MLPCIVPGKERVFSYERTFARQAEQAGLSRSHLLDFLRQVAQEPTIAVLEGTGDYLIHILSKGCSNMEAYQSL